MFISSDPQVGETERRRRRRPNRKPKKCPTVDQIKEKMGEGMEGGDLTDHTQRSFVNAVTSFAHYYR